DDLPRYAELGEVAKARLAIGAVVPDRLVEADQAFLDQVVRVAADQKIRRRLQPHETVIAAHHSIERAGRTLLGKRDQVLVLGLAVSGLARLCPRRAFGKRRGPRD